MYECRECYEDPEISAGKIKQFCKPCNTQVSRAARDVFSTGQEEGLWEQTLPAAKCSDAVSV